jgi:SnoaL-like domain
MNHEVGNANAENANAEIVTGAAVSAGEIDETVQMEQIQVGSLHPVIEQYFQTLNAGEFQATAALFAENGILHPPFEAELVGPEEIATYLQAEAKDLHLVPLKSSDRILETGDTEFDIRGRVKTPLLQVNVAWRLILNPAQQLLRAEVKLLATLAELLPFRQ